MSVYPQGPVFWRGIEPDARSLTIARGARAPIADALWMLSQQWRMGEFRHVFGGVPIVIDVGLRDQRLTSISDPAGRTETLRPGARSDEVLAEPPLPQTDRAPERSPYRLGRSADAWFAVNGDAAAWTAWASLREAFLRTRGSDDVYLRRRAQRGDPGIDGRDLLRAVEARSDTLAASDAWTELVRWARSEGVPITIRPDPGPIVPVDPPVRIDPPITVDPVFDRRPPVFVRPVLDPDRVLRRRRDDPLGGFVLGGTVADLFEHAESFRPTPLSELARVPEPDADLFDPVAGYHFGRVHFAAPGEAPTGFTLRATDDGDLGWWSLDADDATGLPGAARDIRVVPSRMSFAGKPEERFWTVAPTVADWDRASAGTTDLVRMAMGAAIAQMAADWFVVPLTVPRNAVVEVTGIVHRDGFGRIADAPAASDPGRARLWSVHPDRPADTLVTIGDRPALRGRAVEVADLVPDDLDNLLWRIERTLADGNGRPKVVDRPIDRPRPVEADGAPRPTYVLQIDPAGGWYPMAQERDGFHTRPFAAATGSIKTPRAVTLTKLDHVPWGRVPPEGRRTERRWFQGRDADGRPVRWIGRSTSVPERTSGSGLAYDRLLRPSEN